jgi:hypothetical protein
MLMNILNLSSKSFTEKLPDGINAYQIKRDIGGILMLKREGVIAIAAVMLLVVMSSAAYAAPKAVVVEYGFNAGEVPQGRTIVHDFIIKNTGDKTLEVKVKPC